MKMINMIEYITKTGMFGILWISILILTIYTIFKYVKQNINHHKTIPTLITTIVCLIVMNGMATLLIDIPEISKYKTSITLIKDAWFILGPTIINTIIFINNPNIYSDKIK